MNLAWVWRITYYFKGDMLVTLSKKKTGLTPDFFKQPFQKDVLLYQQAFVGHQKSLGVFSGTEF